MYGRLADSFGIQRIQSDLDSGNQIAWFAISVWICPPSIVAAEYVSGWFSIFLLVPVAVSALMFISMINEALFNYRAHVPPFEGEEALEPIPTWAILIASVGFVVTLWIAATLNPVAVETAVDVLLGSSKRGG